jgi:hypothetical protein
MIVLKTSFTMDWAASEVQLAYTVKFVRTFDEGTKVQFRNVFGHGLDKSIMVKGTRSLTDFWQCVTN